MKITNLLYLLICIYSFSSYAYPEDKIIIEEKTTVSAKSKGYGKVDRRETTVYRNKLPVILKVEMDLDLDDTFEVCYYFIGYRDNKYLYVLRFKTGVLVSIEPTVTNLATQIRIDDFDKNAQFDTIQLLEKGELLDAFLYLDKDVTLLPASFKPEGKFYYYDEALVRYIKKHPQASQ